MQAKSKLFLKYLVNHPASTTFGTIMAKKPTRRPKKGEFRTNLRLPDEVAKLVKSRAKANGDSLNGQIVFELSDAGRDYFRSEVLRNSEGDSK